MRTLILDGYNVIHAIPSFNRELQKSLEAARNALIQACKNHRLVRKDIARVYIVFDGRDKFWDMPPGDDCGISVLFTSSGQNADDRILELIEEKGKDGSFVVISNDTYVFNHSRALGAKVISAGEFENELRKAGSSKSKNPGKSKDAGLPEHQTRRITEEYKRHLGIE